MFTEEQIKYLIEQYEKAGEMLRTLSKQLNEAAQKLGEKDALIEQLSKDNLALVAKLDALSGKTAPGTIYAA